MIDLILGTAGHIDHGKTSLVRALTGVDTDRLPEEKRRGITIELGFAELVLGDVRLGIVDVPGHERFVRNMLAGATGVDVALLVIAADDSVKPQTREHLDILKLLNLDTGIIALTKCDLAKEEWMDLVEEEIRDLVMGTFLENAPIIRCSAHSGEGLDELRSAISAAAQRAADAARRRQSAGPFRMAIDRAFTIAGHGTVVTGSVVSGAAHAGDELMVEPGEIRVRIRGVQQHDRAVEEVHRGQRAAINLAGIHHDQVRRGHELASSDFLIPSRLMSAKLGLLPTMVRPLKNRTRGRLHVGTAEVLCSVVLLDREELRPGESALVQLFMAEPVVAVWSQPFVLRSESPVMTIGGGQVLDPHATKIRRSDTARVEKLSELASTDEATRAAAALYLHGLRPWQPSDLARLAGIVDYDGLTQKLLADKTLVRVAVSPTRTALVHREAVEDIARRIEAALKKLHDEFPLNTLIEKSRLVSRLDYLGSVELLDAVLADMERQKKVRLADRGIALVGKGPQLSTGEQKLMEEIVEKHRMAGYQPPTVADLKTAATKNQAVVPQLCKLAAAEGAIVEICPEFYLHADVLAQLKNLLTSNLSGGKGITVSELRELIGTTRKYAVPICEYLDRINFTKRQGDLRVLVTP
jgi:selenocysteine-specific elongation factor